MVWQADERRAVASQESQVKLAIVMKVIGRTGSRGQVGWRLVRLLIPLQRASEAGLAFAGDASASEVP